MGAIQNFKTLAENTQRLDALSIAEAGYAAINTGAALVREMRIEGDELHIGDTTRPLAGRRIFFVGIGKCAIAGAIAIEKIFGDRLMGGIAFDVSSTDDEYLKKIQTIIGTHPLPSETNVQATREIFSLLGECDENDIVLMLISGGGSTLICENEAPMTCVDERTIFEALTAKGATIQEINTVRKHVSLARGGGLAKAAYPAEVVSLIISDVPTNDIEFIASGPTMRDTSTVDDARAIIERYQLAIPTTTTFIETPKEQKYFERVDNILFLTNQTALLAMQDEARRRGYTATIMSDHIIGEARAVAKTIVETLHPMPHKTVLLYAGESTVTLGASNSGKGGPASPKPLGVGGRNQEMALAALPYLVEGELLLPLASDGHDYTDAAGAIADLTTREHATLHNLSIEEHLANHSSYDFFITTGDALVTGYTESNVSDLIIAIKN